MNAGEITAICTGVPAIIGAITALIVAIKANGKVNAHVSHDISPHVPSA